MSFAGSVRRNVLASWGTHASNLVIGFFLTRYTLDVLGVSTYGSWLLINSIASYSALLYCGLGETISRYVAKHHSEGDTHRINQVVTLVLTIYLGMGAIAFLCACALSLTAEWWGGWSGEDLLEARITILILGVNVAVGMSGSVFGGVLHGLRRFDLERGIGFSFDLVRLILFLVFLSDRYGLVTIAGIYFIVALGENLSYIVLGYFPDWIVARLGVMEFLASGHGDTALQNDMTFLRGIQHIDAGPRHAASFVFCDQLLVA